MTFPCERAYLSTNVNMATSKLKKEEPLLKSSLTMFVAIMQKGKAEDLAAYAMSLGIPGPSIFFGNGKGIRDRMGLVRVAINPEKEIMTMVVPIEDSLTIFEKLCLKGHFNVAGEGIIYQLPIFDGISNISSVLSTKDQMASMRQIIQAIDELKGHTDWRKNSGEKSRQESSLNYLNNLVRLTCVVPESCSAHIVSSALTAGAPAASLYQGDCLKSLSNHPKDQKSGLKLSDPQDVIEFILSESLSDDIETCIRKEMEKLSKDFIVVTHAIEKAYTFLEG